MTLQRWAAITAFSAIMLALSACGGDEPAAPPPAPQAVTADAVGHYCGMMLKDHAGPKGQIFVKGRAAPVWFSSIKQVFAYTRLPEEPKGLAAIYVNDLAAAGPDGAAVLSIDGGPPAAWRVGNEVAPGIVLREVAADAVTVEQAGRGSRLPAPAAQPAPAGIARAG